MNKRTAILLEIGVVAMVLFLLAWIIMPKFTGAQNINTPRIFPDDYMRASIERMMRVGTFEPITRSQLAENNGSLQISNSHNFTGLENASSIQSLQIISESPTETPVPVVLPKLLNLTVFRLNGKMFHSLDARNAPNLLSIQSTISPLTEINLQGLEHLETILFSGTEVDSIDLSYHPNLKNLYFSKNQNLKEINIRNNKKLKILNSNFNSLESIDVSQNTELEELDIRFNKLKHVDLTNNVKLKEASVNCETLETVDVSKCTELENLDVSHSNVIKIDISNNPMLKELFCNHTLINTIDATNNPHLEKITLSTDQLMNISIKYVNPKLNIEIMPYFPDDMILKINDRKREIFIANFPDLNPDDYLLLK